MHLLPLLCLLLVSVSAFRWNDPAGMAAAAVAGMTFAGQPVIPPVSFLEKELLTPNVYSNIYELALPFTDFRQLYQNYSVFAEPTWAALCGAAIGPNGKTSLVPGAFVKGSWIIGLDEVCGSYEEYPNVYGDLGAVGMLLGTPGVIPPWCATMFSRNENRYPGFPYIIFKQLASPGIRVEQNPQVWAFPFFAALVGYNLSMYYSLPEHNIIVGALTFESWKPQPYAIGFMCYFDETLHLIALVLAVYKLLLFLGHEGKLQPSLTQIVIGFCFFGSFFGCVSWIFGPMSWRVIMQGRRIGIQFWFWPMMMIYSGALVLGFYFKEVSLLTSSPDSMAALDKLVIPCVIVVLAWLVGMTIVSTLQSAPTLYDIDIVTVLKSTGGFTIAMVCIINLFLGWGVFSLLWSLRNSGSSARGTVLRVAFLGLGVMFTILPFGIVSGYGIGVKVLVDLYSTMLGITFNGLSTSLPCILICLSFRVSVSKEIEISKSATSSTSGSSGSSKSSSSSSSSASGADPVIEL